MKNIIVLFLSLFLVACAGNDASEENGNEPSTRSECKFKSWTLDDWQGLKWAMNMSYNEETETFAEGLELGMLLAATSLGSKIVLMDPEEFEAFIGLLEWMKDIPSDRWDFSAVVKACGFLP